MVRERVEIGLDVLVGQILHPLRGLINGHGAGRAGGLPGRTAARCDKKNESYKPADRDTHLGTPLRSGRQKSQPERAIVASASGCSRGFKRPYGQVALLMVKSPKASKPLFSWTTGASNVTLSIAPTWNPDPAWIEADAP